MNNTIGGIVIFFLASQCLANSNGLPIDAVFEAIGPVDIFNEYQDAAYDDTSLLLAEFPNESSTVYLRQVEKDGKLSYGVASISKKDTQYQVIVDYGKFRIGNYETSDTKVKKGIGLRVKASFTSNERGIDLGSLYAIGLAGQQKKIIGDISVESIGISGPEITPLIPITTQIDVTAIQQIMQSISAIKSKIYAKEGVTISPQIFAIQRVETSEEVDVDAKIISTTKTAMQLKSSTQPQWVYVGHYDYDANRWISGPFLSTSNIAIKSLPLENSIYEVNTLLNVRLGYPSFPTYRLKYSIGQVNSGDKVKIIKRESIGRNKIWIKIEIQ